MATFTVEIRDNKRQLFNQLMEELKFVKSFEEISIKDYAKKKLLEEVLANRKKSGKALKSLAGIWKDRDDITLQSLRDKARKRNK